MGGKPEHEEVGVPMGVKGDVRRKLDKIWRPWQYHCHLKANTPTGVRAGEFLSHPSASSWADVELLDVRTQGWPNEDQQGWSHCRQKVVCGPAKMGVAPRVGCTYRLGSPGNGATERDNKESTADAADNGRQ
jgi:hypothetical protein